MPNVVVSGLIYIGGPNNMFVQIVSDVPNAGAYPFTQFIILFTLFFHEPEKHFSHY